MTINRRRLRTSLVAMLEEHYGTAIVLVPDASGVRVWHVGNKAMGDGLLRQAYIDVFEDGIDPEADNEDEKDDGPLPPACPDNLTPPPG